QPFHSENGKSKGHSLQYFGSYLQGFGLSAGRYFGISIVPFLKIFSIVEIGNIVLRCILVTFNRLFKNTLCEILWKDKNFLRKKKNPNSETGYWYFYFF